MNIIIGFDNRFVVFIVNIIIGFVSESFYIWCFVGIIICLLVYMFVNMRKEEGSSWE